MQHRRRLLDDAWRAAEQPRCERLRPVPFTRPSIGKPENKALVVALSVLQLTVVVLVWLAAIVPGGLAALAVMLWKAIFRGRYS